MVRGGRPRARPAPATYALAAGLLESLAANRRLLFQPREGTPGLPPARGDVVHDPSAATPRRLACAATLVENSGYRHLQAWKRMRAAVALARAFEAIPMLLYAITTALSAFLLFLDAPASRSEWVLATDRERLLGAVSPAGTVRKERCSRSHAWSDERNDLLQVFRLKRRAGI
jgi:hypothetical protein